MNEFFVREEYFNWMFDLVCRGPRTGDLSYRKLLLKLHSIDFRYILHMDSNREKDGIDLRYRFAYFHPDIRDAESFLYGPCTVLEMILALAIRCEETIMDDPKIGDRTAQWFWGMITTLGLGGQYDSNYDDDYIYDCVERFLNREYESNGRGGLFYIRNCDRDLRNVEIWTQLSWYLNTIS